MGIIAIVIAMIIWLGSALILFIFETWYLGVIELFLIIGGLLTISLTFCTHCPHHKSPHHKNSLSKNGCVHGFIGIPARLLKDRFSESYKPWHTQLILVISAAIVLFPQYWMFRITWAFIVYWVLLIVVGILISVFVCRKCENINCPLNKNRKAADKE